MDLGIIGSAHAAPDPATLQPVITATVGAAAVEIGWGWQGYGAFLNQLEIQVDRGDAAGWQMLTYDTTPGYNDTAPHPAALAKWKYRAIYRVDDLRVGLWSAEVSVTVGGVRGKTLESQERPGSRRGSGCFFSAGLAG